MIGPSDVDASFPFRAWVLSTCRKAMIWGVGVLVLLGTVVWWLREPGANPRGRAFGVLAFYVALFLLTLLKIWWTASRGAAVTLRGDTLLYQPLQSFRPRSVPLSEVVECGMREGTQSLRLVRVEPSAGAREFFLNLSVIDGRNEFLFRLGRRLEELGLEARGESVKRWVKPDYDEAFWGVQS